MDELTEADVSIILDALKHAKQKVNDYPVGVSGYPTWQFKQDRLAEIDQALKKVRKIRDIIEGEKA